MNPSALLKTRQIDINSEKQLKFLLKKVHIIYIWNVNKVYKLCLLKILLILNILNIFKKYYHLIFVLDEYK